MAEKKLSPYPHLSWLGTWTRVGHKGAVVPIHMRQVTHCLIYTTRSPAAVRWITGRRESDFDVDAGTVRFSPADDEHHTLIGTCDPGHTFYTLLIPREHLQTIAASEGIFRVPDMRHSLFRRDEALESSLRCITGAGRRGDGEAGRDSAARSLVLRLLEMTAGARPDWHWDSSVFSARAIADLVAYVDAHLRDAPSVGEMSVIAGLSPSHFAKKFLQSTGLTFHRFINRRRVRAAMELLKDDSLALPDLARTLGCSSHSHLTYLFRGMTGMTPARYRKEFRRTIG